MTDHWAVAILGAGAGGLGLAIRLKRARIDDFVLFEQSDGVGGTWRANTYPGAACDIASHLYSFSFELKPDWSRTYATQPEILGYFEHCAEKYGIHDHLRPNTTVVRAEWSASEQCWTLTAADGQRCTADVVVSALGMLRVPAMPDIEGLSDFEGASFHSARWNHDVDLDGRRVAVIGTGASAAQIVPAIAASVGHLALFQRTPAWVMPRLDKAFSTEEQRRFARNPLAARKYRWDIYRSYEERTSFRTGDPTAELLTVFALGHLDHRFADRPELKAKLTPTYPVGCKRVVVSSDFYKSLLAPDVDLITAAIDRVEGDAIITADGVRHRVDAIVFATGFRATEYLHGLEVIGLDGRRLHDDWSERAHAHLGMTVSGYPNFFMLYGPNTNQGGNSIIFILEAQARYVVRALRAMRRNRLSSVDVDRAVMDRYNAELAVALEATVWNSGCDSYFRNANGHITTQLPQTSKWYWRRTRRFRVSEYRTTRRPMRSRRPRPGGR